MRAGRKEEHASPASSLLIMKYNINLFFVTCTTCEHTFTCYKVYTRGGSTLFFSVVCTAVHTLYGVAVHSRRDVDRAVTSGTRGGQAVQIGIRHDLSAASAGREPIKCQQMPVVTDRN